MDEPTLNRTYGNTDLPEGTPQRPLVTFALFAYNQETHIREAVEAAFSQTYSPLEIILSDDCSNDGTFRIMREMATSYCGPHKVNLIRRTVNLGIAYHVNAVFEEAGGTYIVMAAGDDVSCPDRTLIAIEQAVRTNCALFYSDVTPFGGALDFCFDDLSLSSQSKLIAIARSRRLYIGATGVIEKDLFRNYGPLPTKDLYEDQVFGFRAALEGRVEKSERKLVRYRVGGITTRQDNPIVALADYKQLRASSIQKQTSMFQARLADVAKSDHAENVTLVREINREILKLSIEAKVLQAPVSGIFGGHPNLAAREILRQSRVILRSLKKICF
jgi:glycosyltransferase involved in cell wall biosynthesis